VTRFPRVKKGCGDRVPPVMDSLHLALGYLTGLQLLAASPLDWSTLLGTTLLVNTCDAIVCRIVARNNGHPPRLWLGLGFVFGVWALAAVMLARKRVPPRSA
jgi:hypothetical protein